jgi:hypothetical protein
MNSSYFQKIGVVLIALTYSVFAISCTKTATTVEPGKAASPTDAFKMLYTAVKSKDTEKIKMMMSSSTVKFVEGAAAQQNKPVEEVYKNGLTATTFAETMPEIRDERIKDTFGKVEVYNSKDNRWEDLAFVNEEGGWKLAVGDLFAGTFQNPGKSKAQLETENSNSSGANNMVPLPMNANGNFTSGKPAANVANVNTAQVAPEKNAEKEKK